MAVSKYKVDGKTVPAPSLGGKLHGKHRVSISYNNMNADFVDKHVANKDKFTWKWKIVRVSDIQPIVAYIENKLATGPKSNNFSVSSWTLGKGWVTKTMYVGADIETTVISVDKNGDPEYVSVEIQWVQIKGTK